jgi:hypothetical protein
LEAVLVYEDGPFDAAAVGEVGDEAVVFDVAVDDAGRAGLQAVDDQRAVLVAAVDFEGLIALEGGFPLVPACDLVLTSGDILVERDVEPFDQVGPEKAN